MQDKVLQLEQELRDLKTHIAAMEQARTATAPAPPIAAAVATEKKVKPEDKMQVGSTFDLYGFAMLDSGYEFGTNNPDWLISLDSRSSQDCSTKSSTLSSRFFASINLTCIFPSK